jgi:hypothetical protein
MAGKAAGEGPHRADDGHGPVVARAQRKSDERAARWRKAEALRQLVPSGPVQGPGGSTVVISVEQTGLWWLRHSKGPTGGGGGALLGAALLISEAIWWLVFRAEVVCTHVSEVGPAKLGGAAG